jgi:cell division transport system ATP-binding protein
MIRLTDVSVRYANGVEALKQVNVQLSEGEFAFVVGETGSGKSTFLKLLYREVAPQTGSVFVHGEDVSALPPHRIPYLRRKIGVVFQDFRLLPQKTAYENVAFALQAIGADRHQIYRQVGKVLRLVGLAEKSQAYPHELSGGEQQRVSIARALVNDPVLLLADEPTGNLDPRTSREIIQLLADINSRGTTVIVATHDQAIVDLLRQRVIEMVEGQVVRDEPQGWYVRREPEATEVKGQPEESHVEPANPGILPA